LYFSLGTDFAHLVNKTRPPGTSEQDFSVTRLDVLPQIRYPFKKWQWLTANTTFSWRDTYYTRSLAPADTPQVLTPLVDADVNRRYFTIQSQLIGPVFNRIWNTPGNGYAEKFKHTIEPFFTVQRVSSVDNFNRIPQSGGDVEYGGRTRYSYGVNNRFYAKRRTTSNTPATAREFISVELSQFYYTDARAARYDRECQTCQLSTTATKFGPISLNVRATPSNDVNASVRAEFDSRYHDLRTISAQTTYSWSGRLQTTGSWSKSAFIDPLTGLSDPQFRNQSLNVSTSAHTRNNRFGGAYSVYYDVYQKFIRNQRMTGFYNAQCCGIAFEYDTANYTGSAYSTLPGDHRFFMSFTLAGLGNFSPFNGALGGVPR
jgi:hypothetical protein